MTRRNVMIIYLLSYLALIPPVLLIWFIYKLDYVEKEPAGLILQVFILGALTPVIIYPVQSNLEAVFSAAGISSHSVLFTLINAFIIAALVEELMKFLILRIRIWNNKEFNYRFDAMVYAVAVSLGLAATENLAYVFSGSMNYGFNGGLTIALARTLTAIPGHASFAVFMGYYLGEAKWYKTRQEPGKARLNFWMALLVPVCLHGLYDFIAMLDSRIASVIFYIFITLLFIKTLIRVLRSAKHDDYFTHRQEH